MKTPLPLREGLGEGNGRGPDFARSQALPGESAAADRGGPSRLCLAYPKPYFDRSQITGSRPLMQNPNKAQADG